MADRIWGIVRNVGICVAALYGVWKVGPPVVENYYLPTIEFVAGTFHAIAPQPASDTNFFHMRTPMAATHISMVLKTDDVLQAGYGTMPMPEAATMTGVSNNQLPFTVYHNASESSSPDSSQHGSPWYEFSPIFEWCSRTVYQANNAILRNLRQLLDNFYFQVMTFTGTIVSWKLLKQRNKMNIKNLKASHKQDLVGIQEEISVLRTVNGPEISLLTAESKSQKDQLDTQSILLDNFREEARVANEAKTLAEEKMEKMEKGKIDQEEKIEKIEKEKNDQKEKIEKIKKEKIDQEEKIEKTKKEKDDQEEEMKKMEKETSDQQEKMEKMEKGKKNQLEKMEKMEKEKKRRLEKMEKMEKDRKDQQKKIEEMETEKIEQEERLEKIKRAKKKVEEKGDTEVAKARKASEEEVKRAKSDFNAALAIKDNIISEQATRIAGLEGRITTLGDEVDERESAVRTELDSEKLARLDAQQKAKEADGRVEVLKGELAYVLEQKDVLAASLIDVKKPQAHVQNEGDEELDHGDLKDADNAPLGIQRGRLQYNRNKLRSNKRVDGSIYTSKHPQSTPSQQQEALNGQQHPEAQLDTVPEGLCQVPMPAPIQQANNEHEAQFLDSRPARRICPYFQEGFCKFGAKCFNAHDLSSSSENPSKPTEEPLLHSPTSAPVSQPEDQDQSQPSNRKPVKPVCSFFKRGNCRFGAKCHDSHDLSVGRENLRETSDVKPNPPLGNENPSHGRSGGPIGVPRGPRGWRGGASNVFWDARGGNGRRRP